MIACFFFLALQCDQLLLQACCVQQTLLAKELDGINVVEEEFVREDLAEVNHNHHLLRKLVADKNLQI
jgi:hypothetical protein